MKLQNQKPETRQPDRYKLQLGVKIGVAGLIVGIISFLIASAGIFAAMDGTVLTPLAGIETELTIAAALGGIGLAMDVYSLVNTRKRGGSGVPAGLGMAVTGVLALVLLLASL